MVTLQSSLAEYINFGYPKDPKVYVVSVNPVMVPILQKYFNSSFIPPFELSLEKQTLGEFQFKINKSISPGTVFFGPEQIEIKWSGV